MVKRKLAWGVLAALVWATGIAALGAELNVPGDFASLQQAIDAAQEGDVILVAEGTYEPFVVADKKNIIVRGIVDAPERVVINGTVRIKGAVGLGLEWLTITGPGDGVGVSGENKDIVISNTHVVRNVHSGITFARDAIYEGTKILYCEVTYNGRDGIAFYGRGQDILVYRSNISHNGQTTATGVGIRVAQEAQDVVISDNVIVGNPFAGIHPH